MFMNKSLAALGLVFTTSFLVHAETKRYARFEVGGVTSYGIVEKDQVRRIDGDLFGTWKPTDKTFPLKDVKLLIPTQPTNVFAMAGNYRSHVVKGATPTTTVTTTTTVTIDPEKQQPVTTTATTEAIAIPGVVPEKFRIPQPFLKAVSCLTAHQSDIVIPNGATDVHYEAELVVVIGRTARNVSPENAMDFVFGVTCGNDVSERIWQKSDVQWWRAKGSDTFGPCGPFLVTGLDYHNLMVTLRLNGRELQKESTNQLIHDIPNCVSFISQHTTLLPGDLIFMGTSGTTSAMKPGDSVEVEIEGVGILQNKVIAE